MTETDDDREDRLRLMDGPWGGCDLWPCRSAIYVFHESNYARMDRMASWLRTHGDIILGDSEELGIQVGWTCND